jgi:alpha-ketoglutarate-dependent taurine dioxygenase
LSRERQKQLTQPLMEQKVLYFCNQHFTDGKDVQFDHAFCEVAVHPMMQAEEPQPIQAFSIEHFGKKAAPIRAYTNRCQSGEIFRPLLLLASLSRAFGLLDIDPIQSLLTVRSHTAAC